MRVHGFVAAGALALAMTQGAFAQGTVKIGSVLSATGPASFLGEPEDKTLKLYVERINQAGGVNGRKIELVTLDDHGSPPITVENTKKLLAQQPLLLFGYYGSAQVAAAYPLMKDVVLFAPMTAADEFRDAAHPNVYTLRPGYADEAAAITRHALTLGTKRLAILHSTDAESKSALESAQKTVVKLGAVLSGTYPVPTGAVAEAVDSALAGKAESLLVIGDANSAASIIRDVRAKGFHGPIYGFSNTGESLLAEEVRAEGAGVVVARVVPKVENANAPVARELAADAAAAKADKPNVFMLEGYIAARVLTEALKRISGEPTRAKLKAALDGLRNVDVGGFRVDFGKGRVGSKLIDLALIDSQGRVRE
jgi:branched-chain amino acid transport system substrate-binding protein